MQVIGIGMKMKIPLVHLR